MFLRLAPPWPGLLLVGVGALLTQGLGLRGTVIAIAVPANPPPPDSNVASEPLVVMTVDCLSTFAQPLRDAMSSAGSGWFTIDACAVVVVPATKS